MATKRTASAVWNDDLKKGKGALTTQSGTLRQTPYSFNTRFENETGTNPEELIAAAHAGCFTMAFSAALGKGGFTPQKLSTEAVVTLDFINGAPTITTIELSLTGQVPGITPEKFQEIAQDAKANCPVSRVLNAKISLTAKLD